MIASVSRRGATLHSKLSQTAGGVCPANACLRKASEVRIPATVICPQLTPIDR